jgi:hypothetical protein
MTPQERNGAYSSAADRARMGWKMHCRPGCCTGVPHESGAPAAAVDLPCPVGSLDGVECDRARSDRRVAALAAGLPPAPGRDPGHAAVPGEPGGGRDRGRLASSV